MTDMIARDLPLGKETLRHPANAQSPAISAPARFAPNKAINQASDDKVTDDASTIRPPRQRR
ncbi:MAG: hypothetical protein WDA25_00145 [Paracoccaceae bacterium]